jgi:serine/threonine protein kinase
MMANTWELDPGDEIVPGITAERRLGGGERYEAYLGWDERLFAPVVVKVVRPDLVADASTLRGLRREVAMLDKVAHPVVVRSFDADTEGPRPYVVLENLDGPRLSTLLRKYGPLSLEQLLPLGLEVCSALHYLARRGVVHLDVKPSNIIMGSPPRLIDLSIARSREECATLDHVVGTDAYMAPEQCDPPRTGIPDTPADIFGLGATMFEAASGFRPFPKGSDDQSALPHERWPQLGGDPLPLPRTVPDVVAKPIMACLERRSENRPTAAELAAQLQPLVESLPRPVLGGLRAKLR